MSEKKTFSTGPGDQSVTVDHGMNDQGEMANVIRTEGTTLGKVNAPTDKVSSQAMVQKIPPKKADSN